MICELSIDATDLSFYNGPGASETVAGDHFGDYLGTFLAIIWGVKN